MSFLICLCMNLQIITKNTVAENRTLNLEFAGWISVYIFVVVNCLGKMFSIGASFLELWPITDEQNLIIFFLLPVLSDVTVEVF